MQLNTSEIFEWLSKQQHEYANVKTTKGRLKFKTGVYASDGISWYTVELNDKLLHSGPDILVAVNIFNTTFNEAA